jgi:thiol:disulfide interchange protein
LSTPQALTSSTEPFIIVRINKANGNMMTQLASVAQKANSVGLAPFIEFDATWCPACQAIEKSIQAKDTRTMQAFEGVYLIRADVDEWGWGDRKNFDVTAIPVYFQLDKNGKPTGAVIDGAAWNEDIPENFAPVLDNFFHNK